MRIIFLSTFYPYRGGMAQFNACLYRALEKEYFVEAWNFSRQYPKLLFPGKTQLVDSADKADPISAKNVLDSVNPISYHTTAQKVIAEKPDILLETLWMPFLGPSLGYVAKKARRKGIVTIGLLHNVIPHEKQVTDEVLTKYFLSGQDAYIVLTSAVRDDLLKYVPNARYELVGHPLYRHFANTISAEKARKILDIPRDKKILLFFGFIRDYKGLDVLLETMPLLGDDYHLIVAGESYGDFSKYTDIIAKLGIENKVSVFNKYINDDEVQLYFNASDVCVLPYKSATQSGIVGISYHFELPVIVTRVGGLDQMVEPFGTGLVADEANPEMLKAAVMRYFDSEMQANCKLGIANYHNVHSWEAIADAVEVLYEEFKNK
jgi:glycosyltransferase involved in cell wall biosynthesis